MNIGILTLPLYNNYGGILQAYALKTMLENMGHHVVLMRRYSDAPVWKYCIKKILGQMGYARYSSKRYEAITEFVKREFNASYPLLSHASFLNEVKKLNLDAMVVGSDQVWRNDYCLGAGMDYFLDLDLPDVKRMAYAVSFGVDSWNYSVAETKSIIKCLSSFSGISLRENTFIPTLFKHTGYEAEWCLDPTMLLDAIHYMKFVKDKPVNDDYTFVYWLGNEDELKKHLPKNKTVVQVRLNALQCCSIEDWLTYIFYADNIITDSFHGCVFSLLFHKRLSVFRNQNGGVSRLLSLFKMFEMEGLLDGVDYQIDYGRFESLLKKHKKHSVDFINASLAR